MCAGPLRSARADGGRERGAGVPRRELAAPVAADLEEVAAGTRAEVRCRLFQTGEGNGGIQPAGSRARDGSLLLPTIDGVVRISPHTPFVGDVAPLVVIEALTFDDGPIALGPTHELGPGRGDLSVRFTGLSFDAPEQLRFRHRLLGHSDAWVDDGAGRLVSYNNLPPAATRSMSWPRA